MKLSQSRSSLGSPTKGAHNVLYGSHLDAPLASPLLRDITTRIQHSASRATEIARIGDGHSERPGPDRVGRSQVQKVDATTQGSHTRAGGRMGEAIQTTLQRKGGRPLCPSSRIIPLGEPSGFERRLVDCKISAQRKVVARIGKLGQRTMMELLNFFAKPPNFECIFCVTTFPSNAMRKYY